MFYQYSSKSIKKIKKIVNFRMLKGIFIGSSFVKKKYFSCGKVVYSKVQFSVVKFSVVKYFFIRACAGSCEHIILLISSTAIFSILIKLI